MVVGELKVLVLISVPGVNRHMGGGSQLKRAAWGRGSRQSTV